MLLHYFVQRILQLVLVRLYLHEGLLYSVYLALQFTVIRLRRLQLFREEAYLLRLQCQVIYCLLQFCLLSGLLFRQCFQRFLCSGDFLSLLLCVFEAVLKLFVLRFSLFKLLL